MAELLADLTLALGFAVLLYLSLWLLATLISRSAIGPWSPRRIGEAVAQAAAPGPTATALAICIAAFGGLGAATLIGNAELDAFVINREGTVPAFFSSGLLLVSAGLALMLSAEDRPGRAWWVAWGAILIALGLDEVAEFHERLEIRLGVPGPVVLAPLAGAAGVTYLRILRMVPSVGLARRLYLAVPVCWAVALLLDPIHGVAWKSVIEEVLEMTGSALLLIALLLVARDPRGAAEPRAGRV